VLAVESVDGLCGFLPYVAGSYFCATAAPAGMMASLNGMLSAAFYGAGESTNGRIIFEKCCLLWAAGRGLGTSLGSAVISKFGIRKTYLAFAVTSGLTCVLYWLTYHAWLKRIEQKRLTSKSNSFNFD
jgi:hypothetical protein